MGAPVFPGIRIRFQAPFNLTITRGAVVCARGGWGAGFADWPARPGDGGRGRMFASMSG